MKGEQKAPSLEIATQEACPTVRMSVEYSSGVVTQVAFYNNIIIRNINI